jgi:hypothetical protein
MIEDYQKKSSWSMSESIRQLAYGIAQDSDRRCQQGPEQKLQEHKRQQRRDKVIEYRTLSTHVGGRELDITNATSIDSWCEALLATLDKINVHMAYPHSKWFAFAVYQDIEWSTNIGDAPVSVAVACQTINFTCDIAVRYSMDVVYLTAKVQACLYSLRILRQILDVMATLSPQDISEPRQRLRVCLSTLPGIAEYPTAEEMFDLLAQFVKANGLVVVSQILGIPEINLCEPVGRGSANRKKGRQSATTRKRDGREVTATARADSRQPTSSNPFALLGEDAQ